MIQFDWRTGSERYYGAGKQAIPVQTQCKGDLRLAPRTLLVSSEKNKLSNDNWLASLDSAKSTEIKDDA